VLVTVLFVELQDVSFSMKEIGGHCICNDGSYLVRMGMCMPRRVKSIGGGAASSSSEEDVTGRLVKGWKMTDVLGVAVLEVDDDLTGDV
jgi:hypothetical protein